MSELKGLARFIRGIQVSISPPAIMDHATGEALVELAELLGPFELPAHVFYCGECPPLSKAADRLKRDVSEVRWLRERTDEECRRDCTTDPVSVPWQQATRAATLQRVQVDWHYFCDEGFRLLREARAKGWGV